MLLPKLEYCLKCKNQSCHSNNRKKGARNGTEFKHKSKAGFGNCVGAIDGILIWTHWPSPEDYNLA
eukprot:15346321-Ditylum_brightwellii.AAC.1